MKDSAEIPRKNVFMARFYISIFSWKKIAAESVESCEWNRSYLETNQYQSAPLKVSKKQLEDGMETFNNFLHKLIRVFYFKPSWIEPKFVIHSTLDAEIILQIIKT